MNPNRLPLKENPAMKVEPTIFIPTCLQRLMVNVLRNAHEFLEVNKSYLL